ncbi:MAG: cobalamin biosynthesis protein CobQ [Rhodobacter sp.]|nr:cobalamin biosynthesis protein CobQ [Rhodobacter sp.]
MLIGAAVFARPIVPATLVAALLGGLAPDLPMFALVLWSTGLAGVPEHDVFSRLYFLDSWQAVFAVDHSFFVWGLLLALGHWRGHLVLTAFAGSGFLHAAIDFLTHRDDARRQLWPVSDWVFRSPVSYWDPNYYGTIISVVELGLVLLAAAFLCRLHRKLWQRALIVLLAAILVVPVIVTGGFHGLHGMG